MLVWHAVANIKALRYGKDELREPSCGITLNIHQDFLKNYNLLHKQDFVDSQLSRTALYVYILFDILYECKHTTPTVAKMC